MKNKILKLMVLVFISSQTFAQTQITKSFKLADATDHKIELNDEEIIEIIKNGKKFNIEITDIPTTITQLKIDNTNNIPANMICVKDFTNKLSKSILDDKTSFDYKIINGTTEIATIKVSWNKPKSNNEIDVLSNDNRNEIIRQFQLESSFENPYSNLTNRIDLYFDEEGKLLNHLPVNIDQNDMFYFHIISEVGNENRYSINTVQGEYAPVDLSFRPYAKRANPTESSELEKEHKKQKMYTQINPLVAGPFTSEFFKFKIIYPKSNTLNENGPEYSMKVNKLYHVGIGISLISTNLPNPDFKTVINGTDTTIQSFNGGSRSMLTFNAIWYWSVLQQKPKGSIITSGRDILKDEPTFSLKRLYPTVGVSLDGNFNENLFVGAVYEFARGGSIIGGLHYGKTKRLAKGFNEGMKFTGLDSEIKTENVYNTAVFIGINLDTRIFNTLFNRQ